MSESILFCLSVGRISAISFWHVCFALLVFSCQLGDLRAASQVWLYHLVILWLLGYGLFYYYSWSHQLPCWSFPRLEWKWVIRVEFRFWVNLFHCIFLRYKRSFSATLRGRGRRRVYLQVAVSAKGEVFYLLLYR